ncbi:hypothetical protein NDU88_007081 [Pleurodeles waltl]|uniref:Uncharacterized protein n=1 Tax=Pleurodeles waltl TaxID=8319 RepID=A0AAV7VPP8_PLEWA|nr:hypothetical protein NDU88_007081 [Pleurodeles waltl]
MCSRPNPPGPGSRCTAPAPPAPVPPLGTATGRASSPQERGRSRVHGPSLIPGPRSIWTEETSSCPEISFTSPGSPRRCTAGPRSPGAPLLTADTFRLTSAHKGPGSRTTGPASPASSTEWSPQRGSLPPRVQPSAAVPAAILDLSSQPRLVLLRLKYAEDDSRASFNVDGGDLLASRDILHFSRAPAQMHSRAQVARSPPPHRRHVSPHIGPQGAWVPDRRAGVSGILHQAVAPAGEPPTSGSAERRSPGRHF